MAFDITDPAHDALALAKLVKERKVQPIELVDAAIKAIEQANPTLNAVNIPMFEIARARASRVDLQAPFAGVPYLLKDIRASYKGVPTSEGCRALAGLPRGYDSEIVTRHKRAGLICIGKTNTPEFGLTATTEPYAFGPTRNPWAPDRTSGGSSGGAAAAVSARVVPIAHASDGGGSIRIPAACCGVFGLKPTRGRNPLGPDAGDVMSGLVAEHAVTVSVRDSAALLDATAGADVGDPYWAPPLQGRFLDALDTPLGKLRVAFSIASPAGGAVHADCARAVEAAAGILERLGHRVEPASPEWDDRAFRKAFTTVWFSSLAATLARLAQGLGREVTDSDVEPVTLEFGRRGAALTGAEYVAALEAMQHLGRIVGAFHERYDVWLTPVLAEPPPPLGHLHPPPGREDFGLFSRRVREWVPFTQIANATGQPAASVPIHWTPKGLPVGVQIMAAMGREDTLLKLAAQMERACPWKDRLPAAHAGFDASSPS